MQFPRDGNCLVSIHGNDNIDTVGALWQKQDIQISISETWNGNKNAKEIKSYFTYESVQRELQIFMKVTKEKETRNGK